MGQILKKSKRSYRSGIQITPWLFGFTIRRFSFFVGWKCDTTMKNYARLMKEERPIQRMKPAANVSSGNQVTTGNPHIDDLRKAAERRKKWQ
jgi:hypothetical protein